MWTLIVILSCHALVGITEWVYGDSEYVAWQSEFDAELERMRIAAREEN